LSQSLPGDGLSILVFSPRAMVEAAKILNQIMRREALRMAAFHKGLADVIQSLNATVNTVGLSLEEDPAEGQTRLPGPIAADSIGKREQRLDVFVLMRVQMGQLIAGGFIARIEEKATMICDPAPDELDEKLTLRLVLGEANALDRGRPGGAQADGNTAVGERGRQRTATSEGLGAEDIECLYGAAGVPGEIALIMCGPAGEHAYHLLAVRGREGDMAIIQQDYGPGVEQLANHGDSRRSGHEPGIRAKIAEELKTCGFAGAPLHGMNVQIRRNGASLIGVGMHDPEGEHGELIGRADQVTAQETGEPVHDLRRFRQRADEGAGRNGDELGSKGLGPIVQLFLFLFIVDRSIF